ncbi:MAG: lipid-A-disaccharide synthase [Candidatus Omnitrophica bacterium]|nr:lipid-A-disaccharide synthase [Candidatus Omnitrophota bacterium]
MKKTVLIIAGETSGDIHAANLVKHLKSTHPDLSFFGIGGKRMLEAGVDVVERMEKLSIIGVSEVFAKLGHINRAYKKVLARVKDSSPHLAILVDYPGFNLTIAKRLKKTGLTVIYYITPQIWAWGKSRAYSIKKYVDKAIVIFGFEEGLLRSYGIDATFVGHPILDAETQKTAPTRESLGLDPDKLTIALLPGSRESEVRNMLPVMLRTASIVSVKKDTQFILAKTSDIDDKIYAGILAGSKLRIAGIKDNTYGTLALADFTFTSSGTATLECAIMERPMVIIYKTSFLTALLFRLFAKTSFIGLVNIIAKREIAPEILQYDATPGNLARTILSIVSSKEKMEEQARALREVKNTLGSPGASQRAADIVKQFL